MCDNRGRCSAAIAPATTCSLTLLDAGATAGRPCSRETLRGCSGPGSYTRATRFLLFLCFLPYVSVAGGERRLPEANIAFPFRRKGCAKDPASPALRARRLWPGGTAAGGSPLRKKTAYYTMLAPSAILAKWTVVFLPVRFLYSCTIVSPNRSFASVLSTVSVAPPNPPPVRRAP